MRRPVVALLCLVLLAASTVAFEHGALASKRVYEGISLLASLTGLAWASHGRWREVLMILCSLVFGLTAIEGGALIFTSKSLFARSSATSLNDGGLNAPRDIVGWGPRRPGVFRLEKTGPAGEVIYDVHATIDAHLNRLTHPSSGMRAIAFFGDSFVFGDGLDDKDTLPQAFADLNGGTIPVLNLAFSGWAPSQNLAALQAGLYNSQLASPAHFIMFSAAFHVERTACKRDYALGSGPRYVLDRGSLVNAGTCRQTQPRFFPSIFLPVWHLLQGNKADVLTSTDVETYIKIIEAFAATAKNDFGVMTTLLYEPASDDDLAGTGYTSARVLDELRAYGVDVLVETHPVNIGEDLLKIPGDGHPSGFANRATAQLIEDHLRLVDPQALRAGQTKGP